MSGPSGRFAAVLANFQLTLRAVAFSMAVAEVLSWVYASRARPDLRLWEGDVTAVVDQVPEYGYVLAGNRTLHAVKHMPDGGVCYDVTYRTDTFGRRPVQQGTDPSRPHMILFGCSVTMGEGLDDPDTLAAKLDEALPGYNIYNYGVHGYGPQHMLARLQSRMLPAEIVSDRGVALYVLLPVHISRAIGDTRAFWIYTSPYYTIDGDDTLVRHGSFDTGRPYTTRLYRSLTWLKAHSWFLSVLDVNLPLRLVDRDAQLTPRILEEARREYRAQFHGELYVVFHPTWARGNPETDHLLELMRTELAAAGVPVLDYSTDLGLTDDEVVNHACDLHPNGRLNAELAALLARDVGPPH